MCVFPGLYTWHHRCSDCPLWGSARGWRHRSAVQLPDHTHCHRHLWSRWERWNREVWQQMIWSSAYKLHINTRLLHSMFILDKKFINRPWYYGYFRAVAVVCLLRLDFQIQMSFSSGRSPFPAVMGWTIRLNRPTLEQLNWFGVHSIDTTVITPIVTNVTYEVFLHYRIRYHHSWFTVEPLIPHQVSWHPGQNTPGDWYCTSSVL